jgi:PIN domain nuclease of toxin-antitoxin system
MLWLAQGNTKLSGHARSIIEDSDNQGAVSAISLWELSLKAVLGKLNLQITPSDLERLATQEGLLVLSLTVPHIDRFHQLPTVHRDPFDRLIAAVALAEGFTILSPDVAFDGLGVGRAW